MLKTDKTRDERIDSFLDTLTWFHSEKTHPTGLFHTIGEIRGNLVKLNDNIKDANNSSDKLSKALNNLTLYGVIVAGCGVIVAIINLIIR
jgi:hypothetical protein